VLELEAEFGEVEEFWSLLEVEELGDALLGLDDVEAPGVVLELGLDDVDELGEVVVVVVVVWPVDGLLVD
jgi:hypothetical protein